MSAPRICAVVVTYNRVDLLSKSLDGLLGQTRLTDEILVIDNASTDGTTEMLASRYQNVVVHRLPRNMGASGGFSEGVRVAYENGFDWIWLLDDDVVAEPQCLEELLEVAIESGKLIVTPTRRSATGTYPRNEAVINEATQSYRCPADNDSRWVSIDIFTFEGPLIHRSVVDRVGTPNARFFIIADDTEYSVRIYREFGPLASALANRTAVNRLIPLGEDLILESQLKRLVTGNSNVAIKADDQHWKQCYYLRNRHLIWKQLGWRRRRVRQLVIHGGFLFTDAFVSFRRGWDWRLRLKTNAQAFWLGLIGKDGAFIDPATYHATRKRRAEAKN